MIQSLVKQFPSNGPFFDVGGGNGFVAKGLQDAGFTTILVEPGESGVINARKRGVENVVQSMWSLSTVRPGIAATVGLFDVVEHIEDDLGFLRGVHETLQDAGRIFITVPAYRSLWSFEDVHAGHFRRYRLCELSRLLGKAGFRAEFASYLFCPLPLPIFLLRTIPSLLGIRRSVDENTTRQEHSRRPGFLGRQIERILRWEQSLIERLQPLPFGSSCLIVGRKIARSSN